MSSTAYIITGIILFAAAALFLAAELFLPSHGLLGIFSGIFAVTGVVALFMASQTLGAISALSLIIIAPVTLYYAIKYYPNSPVGKRVILQAPTAREADAHAEQTRQLQELVGKRGVAATDLRPAGMVDIEGKRIDSMSESEVIAIGSPIEVVRVTGMRVIVRSVS
jgi:membrane-bound serine protease (ClpP class)